MNPRTGETAFPVAVQGQTTAFWKEDRNIKSFEVLPDCEVLLGPQLALPSQQQLIRLTLLPTAERTSDLKRKRSWEALFYFVRTSLNLAVDAVSVLHRDVDLLAAPHLSSSTHLVFLARGCHISPFGASKTASEDWGK